VCFFGPKGNDLVPEKVRVDALLNPCCLGVLMNNLPSASSSVVVGCLNT